MKAFLPENLQENLKIFAELTYPGIMYSGHEQTDNGISGLLEIADYTVPIQVFTEKKMNL